MTLFLRTHRAAFEELSHASRCRVDSGTLFANPPPYIDS